MRSRKSQGSAHAKGSVVNNQAKKRSTPAAVTKGSKVQKGHQKSAAPTSRQSQQQGKASKTTVRSAAVDSRTPTETPSISAYGNNANQLNFTSSNLETFLRRNNLSHCIRTEMLPPTGARGPFRVSVGEKLITIGGIGRQQQSTSTSKLWGSIVLASRQKVRIISLKSLFGGRAHAST